MKKIFITLLILSLFTFFAGAEISELENHAKSPTPVAVQQFTMQHWVARHALAARKASWDTRTSRSAAREEIKEPSRPDSPKKKVKPSPARTEPPAVSSGSEWVEKVRLCIMHRESRGNYKAQNKTSTASGAYQFIDGTWNHYRGYAHAKDAPASVQDAYFYKLFNGGKGKMHWNYPPQQCW